MRKRVLVVRQILQPPTGGTAVAVWMVEALRGVHQVGVLTCEPVDLVAINRYYGTSLQPSDLTVHRVPTTLMTRCLPSRGFELWRYGDLLRSCRQLRADYDVLISVTNEADFGAPGIQYVHYPRFLDPRVNPHVTRPVENGQLTWYHRSRPLMQAYFRMCGFGTDSLDRMRRNLTLVNSDWTGQRFTEAYGVAATTLYPPVPNHFPTVPWEERENGFVCIGRIAPEKRLEDIIAILSDVRQRGHAPHLHIIGTPVNQRYLDHIKQLQAERASWVHLEIGLGHTELAQLVARHKYGIHARQEEHFGITVAEMVNAGCIVFVPNSGGQVEIVGNRPDLIYQSAVDAVEKIDRMLRSPEQERALREHLTTRQSLFSTTAFMQQIRSIVEQFDARAVPSHSPSG